MDKKEFIEEYNALDQWCKNASKKLRDNSLMEGDYFYFTIDTKSKTIWLVGADRYVENDSASEFWSIPLDVYYNDNVDDYIDNYISLKNEREKEELLKQELNERLQAIETIKQLKEKYNL